MSAPAVNESMACAVINELAGNCNPAAIPPQPTRHWSACGHVRAMPVGTVAAGRELWKSWRLHTNL